MTRSKNNCCGSKEYGTGDDPAEKEHYRGDYGQCQRPENAAFPEADDPNQAVGGSEGRICDEVKGDGTLEQPSEGGAGDVEYHEREAPEAAYLLRGLHEFVVPSVLEAIPAFCGEYYIGDHDNGYENESIKIKPLHKNSLLIDKLPQLYGREKKYIFRQLPAADHKSRSITIYSFSSITEKLFFDQNEKLCGLPLSTPRRILV